MRALASIVVATCAIVALAAPAHAAPDVLDGKVIVLDPGHQLGNFNPRFAKQLAQTKFNGSVTKACNTTGTATNKGLPEATFTWRVANELKRMLEAHGATVVMTRSTNSRDDWGPCTWDRARIANEAHADAMISIHGNGAPSRDKGFFAIVPTRIKGYTDDVVAADRRLVADLVAGMTDAGAPPSNTMHDSTMTSSIMTTINLSDVPTTIVELGNMRNAADARRMSSKAGQRQYARWLMAGLQHHFSR